MVSSFLRLHAKVKRLAQFVVEVQFDAVRARRPLGVGDEVEGQRAAAGGQRRLVNQRVGRGHVAHVHGVPDLSLIHIFLV